ncbi:hypothetical protein GGD38_006173 [Chitinophagaceae bacterium OAS944]|nr:hypothetical protein [Chitinophagaceae bacterium OAS944]
MRLSISTGNDKNSQAEIRFLYKIDGYPYTSTLYYNYNTVHKSDRKNLQNY